jgi:ribosomal protection tetracycline resistance protein
VHPRPSTSAAGRSLNLGILAHVDAGKTTLTERLLHLAGVIDEPGSVDSGTTQTDSLALERRRGITIKSAVVAFALDDLVVNVIDTPGHPDFIAEVERVLGVLDGCVLVLSAVEGVQPQTRILMRALKRLGVPTLLFVNKIDRVGADVDAVLDAVRARLTPAILPMGMAGGLGARTAAFTAYADDDRSFRERETLALAEHDDVLLAAYVDGEDRTPDQLMSLVAEQTRAGDLHPVFAGSAATGAGVPELVAGIARLLPRPEPESAGDDASGRVFKVDRGAAGEKVAYVRLFSGALRARQRLDLTGGRSGKVSRIEVFRDGRWVRAAEARSGQVARLLGLGAVRVGDGFGRSARAEAHHFPPPTLEASVEACDPAQRPALRVALAQLADQDPLIAARTDEDGRPTVSLYGRVQQEVIASTLAEEHGIEVEFSEASVLHVERLRRVGTSVERFNTPTNPYGVTIGLRLSPAAPGSGVVFDLDVPLRDLPLFLFKSVEHFTSVMERHVARALSRGPSGWEVTDCRVTLTEVGYTSWDGPPSQRGELPTALDYRKLTPVVVRQAVAAAATQVCEPVLRVSLEVPTRDAPQLLTLLGRWGTELTGQTSTGDLSRIDARLVASRLHDLQHQLPDLTGGEGLLESSFDGYQPVRGRGPTRRP